MCRYLLSTYLAHTNTDQLTKDYSKSRQLLPPIIFPVKITDCDIFEPKYGDPKQIEIHLESPVSSGHSSTARGRKFAYSSHGKYTFTIARCTVLNLDSRPAAHGCRQTELAKNNATACARRTYHCCSSDLKSAEIRIIG